MGRCIKIQLGEGETKIQLPTCTILNKKALIESDLE